MHDMEGLLGIGALVPVLDASLGPDVLLEVSSPISPVVVRSADQGGFTTVIMRVHDTVTGG